MSNEQTPGAPTEQEWVETLAKVHRRHGIWGFNGSQVRCQCGPTWFQTNDWYAHVAAEQAAALRALPTGGER